MNSSANGSAKLTGMCGSCPAFVISADNRTGNCHGEPPKPFLVPQKDANGKIMTDIQGQAIVVLERLYPPVLPDVDWCMQHPWWREHVAPPLGATTEADMMADLKTRMCEKHGVVDCKRCAPAETAEETE